jgi:hypothetical protein
VCRYQDADLARVDNAVVKIEIIIKQNCFHDEVFLHETGVTELHGSLRTGTVTDPTQVRMLLDNIASENDLICVK